MTRLTAIHPIHRQPSSSVKWHSRDATPLILPLRHAFISTAALTINKYWQRLNVCKQQVKNGAELENHQETHTRTAKGMQIKTTKQSFVCRPFEANFPTNSGSFCFKLKSKDFFVAQPNARLFWNINHIHSIDIYAVWAAAGWYKRTKFPFIPSKENKLKTIISYWNDYYRQLLIC